MNLMEYYKNKKYTASKKLKFNNHKHSLQVLDLSKIDIDSIPLDAFRGLSKLQQIDLSNNRFVTVPESLTLVGETLKYLTFNNNPIVELNDDSFIGN